MAVDASDLTYPEVGATAGALPPGYHHVRAERTIGRGREAFDRAVDALLAGEMQRRAGAEVTASDRPFHVGTVVRMRVRVGPLRIDAPCLVVWAERAATSAGFAYGTLPGHPECGEERFTVPLAPDGDVVLRITAFSAPGRWYTRLGAPFGRWVQGRMTRRYLDALTSPG